METISPQSGHIADSRLSNASWESRALVVLLRLYLVTIGVLCVVNNHRYWPSWPLFVCLIPLPSLVVAIGIGAGRRWAAWLAIAHDLLLMIGIAGFQISFGSYAENAISFDTHTALSDMLFRFAPGIVLAPLMVLELAFVAQFAGLARRSVLAVGLAAFVSLGAGVAAGVRMANGIRSVYQPLVEYANSHWLTLPDDLRPVTIDSGEWTTGKRSYNRLELVLTSAKNDDREVHLYAVRSAGGGYRLQGISRSDRGRAALAVSAFINGPSKPEEAKAALSRFGLEPSIRYKGFSLDDVVARTSSPVWKFYSPTRKATYLVSRFQIVVLPDAELP